MASAARETDDKARVDVIIISSKGKLKLKDINAAVTVSEFIETTVIPQLFSKHLMKLKHLRVLVNGKEASDHSKTLTSYSTRKQSVIKLKINVLFSQAYHSLSEKERVKLLRNEEDVKQETCSSTAKKTQVVEPSDKTVQIYTLGNQSVSHGNDTTTKSLRVVVVHGTQKYNFDAEDSRTTTVLALKLKLKDILGLKSINRIKLVGKGKVLTDDQVQLATLCSSSSKKKVKIRLLHDETFYKQEDGRSVLEMVLQSLSETKKAVHSLYAQLAHNFYDDATMTLQSQGYDNELENLKRSLQSIKVKDEDLPKIKKALEDLAAVVEENDKVNELLARR